MSYAPCSARFPRAAAVILHCGIGTSGQALRPDRLKTVVPHFGPQLDTQPGSASSASPASSEVQPSAPTRTIRGVLDSPELIDTTLRAAEMSATDNGAKCAATRIMSLVRDT